MPLRICNAPHIQGLHSGFHVQAALQLSAPAAELPRKLAAPQALQHLCTTQLQWLASELQSLRMREPAMSSSGQLPETAVLLVHDGLPVDRGIHWRCMPMSQSSPCPPYQSISPA